MMSVVRSVAKLRDTPSVVETREIKLTLRDISSIFYRWLKREIFTMSKGK